MENDFYGDISEEDVLGGLFLPDNRTSEDIKKVGNNIRLFKQVFVQNMFKGVNYIIYEVVLELSKFNPIITPKQFKSAVTNSLGILVNVPEVKDELDSISEAEDKEDVERDLLQACITTYSELQQLPIDETQFKSNLAILANKVKQNRYNEILLNVYKISTEGMKYKGRFIQGLEEAEKFHAKEFSILTNMVVDRNNKSQVIMSGVEGLQDVLNNMDNLKKKDICRFNIAPLDQSVRTLKTSEMIAIFGPPKGGKSRFQANIVHEALINGHDVCIKQLEGKEIEYEAMLVARHMAFMYGSNPLDDEMIQDNRVPDEWQSKLTQCRNDLYTNPKYGRFYIDSGTLVLETLESQLLNIYETWRPYEVLVIDYPSLIQSVSRKSDTEIVTSAFRRIKTFITTNNILGIIPHQMQTDTFNKLKAESVKDGDLSGTSELDSSGGADSSESVKSPDLVLGIFSTQDMKIHNQMYIRFVAARRKKPFPMFKVRTILGQCIFQYDASINNSDSE